jgi:hypothetical protein
MGEFPMRVRCRYCGCDWYPAFEFDDAPESLPDFCSEQCEKDAAQDMKADQMEAEIMDGDREKTFPFRKIRD